MSKTIFNKNYNGLDLVIRYPSDGDEKAMMDYINELSAEKTFILMQGETMTLEEEIKYLDSWLEKISKKTGIMLSVFAEDTLIGVGSIELGRYSTKHVGLFSISIKNEYRGKGIGKLLMSSIIDEAKKQLKDLEIINLTVQSENIVAQKMYESFGFKKYGLLPRGIKLVDGYRDHQLMYKQI
ncbi:MAG: GNAT family N-acetyltransferase [Candidatus Pacebacteria bacterium]|nr:GNAT family N-acetyltransferase [Candidatus Paceibacterota bacterium]